MQNVKSVASGSHWRKIGVALSLMSIAGLAYWQLGDRLSLDYIAQQDSQLRFLQVEYPVLAALAAVAIYVAVAGLSLPGAAVLTLVFGWYFGFWKGLLLVSLGSTGGATIAFLVSRYLFREWIQRIMQERLAGINAVFDREGAYYLFTLRLVPAVPFFVINAVMGLTKIRVATFWWVSQLGMLPGTAAYVYAGSLVPSLQTLANEGVGKVISWQLVLAFTILGVLPLAIKKAIALFSLTSIIKEEPQ